MTLHPREAEAPAAVPFDAALHVEDALRIARACSHSKKLERPIAVALDAIVEFGKAVVDRSRQMEAELAEAKTRIAALETGAAAHVRPAPPAT